MPGSFRSYQWSGWTEINDYCFSVPVKSWFDLFQEHTYADACLARITDKRHCYRLEMNGISMRDTDK